MKKVWNRLKGAYEFVAEGLVVDGIDYDAASAYKKWTDRQGASKCRTSLAKRLINDMIEEGASFTKHHKWLEEMEYRILLENHSAIERVKGKGRGVESTKEFNRIPSKYRPGILAIANSLGDSYSRGPHSTCPARQTGAVKNFKEYHLTRGKEGRATTAQAKRGGDIYIYYSTSHAFGTYDYYLVTIPTTIEVNGGSVTKHVPLTAGRRDGLITIPTA